MATPEEERLAAFEAARWEEQLSTIDAELKEIGGQPMYEALPPGFIDGKEFKERCEVILRAIRNSKNEISKIEVCRDVVEGREKQALCEESLSHVDIRVVHWQHQLNGQKNCLLDFLQWNSAMDAASFLESKHKLLDQKLDLLMKKRWKEAGLGLAPSLP